MWGLMGGALAELVRWYGIRDIPSFTCLNKLRSVMFRPHRCSFKDRGHIVPRILVSLLHHWSQHRALERRATRTAEILQYAPRPRERSPPVPHFGQHIIQPCETIFPIANNVSIGGHFFHGLDNSLKDRYGYIIGNVLTTVGKWEHCVPWDPTNDVVRRVTRSQVLLIRDTHALIGIGLSDTPRPHRVLVLIIGRCAKIELRPTSATLPTPTTMRDGQHTRLDHASKVAASRPNRRVPCRQTSALCRRRDSRGCVDGRCSERLGAVHRRPELPRPDWRRRTASTRVRIGAIPVMRCGGLRVAVRHSAAAAGPPDGGAHRAVPVSGDFSAAHQPLSSMLFSSSSAQFNPSDGLVHGRHDLPPPRRKCRANRVRTRRGDSMAS